MKIKTWACYACALSLLVFYGMTDCAVAGGFGIFVGWVPAIFPST